MKILNSIIFICIFSFCTQLLAQGILVKGYVLDKETNEPLPFANIMVLNTNNGTSTNFEGFFTINLPDANSQIKVSYIGYKSQIQSQLKSNAQVKIYLEKEPIFLKEIVVTPDYNYAVEVLKNARQKLLSTNSAKTGKYFYKNFTLCNGESLSAQEAFLEIGFDKQQMQTWNEIEGRQAFIKSYIESPVKGVLFATISNDSYLIKIFSPLEDLARFGFETPLAKDPQNKYFCSVEGYKKIAGRDVVLIKTEAKNNTKNTFSGKFEIFEDTFEIYSMEFINNNINFLLANFSIFKVKKYFENSSAESFNYKIKYNFNSDKGNHIIPENIIMELNYKLKFFDKDVKVDKKVVLLLAEEYGVNDDTKTEKTTSLSKVVNDVSIINNLAYNPEFWDKNSNTLNEIPFEEKIKQDFIRQGFYGNLFPPELRQNPEKASLKYFTELARESSDLLELNWESDKAKIIKTHYYFLLHLFVNDYFFSIPEEKIKTIFSNKVSLLYDKLFQKYENGEISKKQDELIKKLITNNSVDNIKKLFVFIDAGLAKEILLDLSANLKTDSK